MRRRDLRGRKGKNGGRARTREVKVGTKLSVRVPALHDRAVELEVRVIGAKGEYTGWRATRATGNFDLRTFEIRAYPTNQVDGLRAIIDRGAK